MELAPAGGIVVRLRGLPTKATKEDVVEFLKEWQPAAVYLAFTTRRSTGEAYVVFDTREQAEGACSKDKDIFGPKFGERYVRVSIQEDATPADLQSLEGAPKASKPRRPHQKMESVVKVTGLPRGITAAEVRQLFWGWQVKHGRTFVRDATNPAAAVAAAAAAAATAAAGTASGHSAPESSGMASGSKASAGTAAAAAGAAAAPAPATTAELRAEAFVDFEHAEHAAAAVSTRHGTTITTSAGMFQLAVRRASKAEWDAVVEAARGGEGGGDGIVRVRGLPPRAVAGDVLAFFQGCRVKQGGVHVQPCADNRHSKLALVVFEGPEEAARAMERDRRKLGEAFGDRCCMLELISRAEFEQELQRFGLPGSGGNGNSSSSGNTAVGAAATSLGRAGMAALQSGSVPSMPSGSMSMSLAAMPQLGMGLPGMGMLPQAAAAAAGFMTPGLPHLPHGTMLPGAGFGPGALFPHMHASWPPGAMPMAAAAFGAASGVPGMFGAPSWPGMPPAQPNPASARYMVQDLTTGQKVFLDPRFNLSGYGALPPGLASCSVVATAGTTAGGTATGPTASQHTQAQSGAAGGAGERPTGEASENSNGLKSGLAGAATGTGTGTGGTAGQSSDPTPVGGVPGSGNGNGSSGNGFSVAQAGAVAGAAAKSGPGTSVQREAAAATGDGGGSSEQIGGQAAGAPPQAPRHRHSHHHHHRHGHHHHHNHYRAHASGNGGSSGDEGRTNGGSGGGSNDGGSNDGSGAEEPAGNGRSSNNKAAGDNSSGNDPAGGAAAEGGSSGEGSGADDGATRRTAGCALSRQAGPGEGGAGGVADMEEDAAASGQVPPAQWRQPPPQQRETSSPACPPQVPQQPAHQGLPGGSAPTALPGAHVKDRVHAHTPDDPAALQAEAAQPPPKRARDH